MCFFFLIDCLIIYLSVIDLPGFFKILSRAADLSFHKYWTYPPKYTARIYLRKLPKRNNNTLLSAHLKNSDFDEFMQHVFTESAPTAN